MTAPSQYSNYALGWSVNDFNNWWHNGSLPGTTTEIVRSGNAQLNWAILLNTRSSNANALGDAVDGLVWQVLPTINAWPTHDLFTSAESITPKENLIVFPSLSTGFFHVRVDEPITIHVYNMLGQCVWTKDVTARNSLQVIDLTDFPQGVYTVLGSGKSTVESQKIIRQ